MAMTYQDFLNKIPNFTETDRQELTKVEITGKVPTWKIEELRQAIEKIMTTGTISFKFTDEETGVNQVEKEI